MTTMVDLMRGKLSDEDLWLLKKYRGYMSEIEKEFDLPVTKWGVDEWKAVAKVAITEKVRQKPSLEAYQESIKEIKKLYKTYRSGGTGKKGRVYEPKASIQEVVIALKNRSLDTVLRYLENEENCEKIYLAGGVLFGRVDRGKINLEKSISSSNISPEKSIFS